MSSAGGRWSGLKSRHRRTLPATFLIDLARLVTHGTPGTFMIRRRLTKWLLVLLPYFILRPCHWTAQDMQSPPFQLNGASAGRWYKSDTEMSGVSMGVGCNSRSCSLNSNVGSAFVLSAVDNAVCRPDETPIVVFCN